MIRPIHNSSIPDDFAGLPRGKPAALFFSPAIIRIADVAEPGEGKRLSYIASFGLVDRRGRGLA
jgi:hypothetical protein